MFTPTKRATKKAHRSAARAAAPPPAPRYSAPTLGGVHITNPMVATTLYGHVVRARTARGDVAVKVYSAPAAAARKGYVQGKWVPVPEDVDTELEVLAQASAHPHPHVLGAHPAAATCGAATSVADALATGKPLVTVTEWCDGGDLLSAVQQHLKAPGRGIPIEGVRRVFVHAVRGVAHLHSLGYAHLDISPENVMLTGSGDTLRGVICDYGASAPLGTEPDFKLPRGKAAYMAPEMAHMCLAAGGGRAADVHCLGATLFTALAGCKLYTYIGDKCYAYVEDGNIAALVLAWGLGHRVDAKALDLITRMTCPDPERRPSLAEVLEHPWCAGVPEWSLGVAKATGRGLSRLLVGVGRVPASHPPSPLVTAPVATAPETRAGTQPSE